MCWRNGIGSGLGLSLVRGEKKHATEVIISSSKKKTRGNREAIREAICDRHC